MNIFKTMSALIVAASVMTSCGESKTQDCTASTEGNAQAVINNIMTRTSIRQFTDQQISADTLNLLVKAGMAAPTAMDKRPWAFVVVTDRAVLDSLSAIKPWFNLKTATAAIIVCGDMGKAIEGPGRQYWVQDCSAATENILLAAHACGLGAVWCGVYPGEEIVNGVKRVLELPDNIIPLNVVTMGYPAVNPEPKDKYDAACIHYQKW